MRRQHPTLQLALLLPAVVLLLLAATPSIQAQDATATTAAAAPEANSTAALNTTAPAASNTATAASVPTGNATDNATTLTLSSVDQQLPPFKGLRSCLPFNILLAAAKVSGFPDAKQGDVWLLVRFLACKFCSAAGLLCCLSQHSSVIVQGDHCWKLKEAILLDS